MDQPTENVIECMAIFTKKARVVKTTGRKINFVAVFTKHRGVY